MKMKHIKKAEVVPACSVDSKHRLPRTQAICGGHPAQPNFWKIRHVRALLNGLLNEDDEHVAPQTAIVHIMKSLDDIEAALWSANHNVRCNQCGVMMHDESSLQVLGGRFCMECGTRLVEFESADEGLRQGLADDLARQAEFGKYPSGLYHAYEKDNPNQCYWQRICVAAPEVGEAWLNLRKRLS